MTDQELRDAIAADPEAASLAASGNDAGCAARMAIVLPPIPDRYVPIRRLIYWGALTGARAKFEQQAASDASPVQSIALAYMDMVKDSGSPGLDLQDPAIVGATAEAPGYYVAGSGHAVTAPGMLDAFAAAGVFAASGPGSKDDLLSQGTSSPASVSAADVSRAMLPDRPEGRIA